MSIEVSIVVPAFAEERRLPSTLARLAEGLPSWFGSSWEVVVVDDGSTDRTSSVAELAARTAPVVVLRSQRHRGKGAAIRQGVARSRGEVVVLLDADLPVGIEAIHDLVTAVTEADLVVASRRLAGACVDPPQPWARRYGAQGFLAAVRAMGHRTVSDPQCGAKAFRRSSVGPVIAQVRADKFAFDLELIERCRRGGLRIVEVPVHWHHVGGSSVRPLRDAVVTLWDVARMRRTLPGLDGVA